MIDIEHRERVSADAAEASAETRSHDHEKFGSSPCLDFHFPSGAASPFQQALDQSQCVAQRRGGLRVVDIQGNVISKPQEQGFFVLIPFGALTSSFGRRALSKISKSLISGREEYWADYQLRDGSRNIVQGQGPDIVEHPTWEVPHGPKDARQLTDFHTHPTRPGIAPYEFSDADIAAFLEMPDHVVRGAVTDRGLLLWLPRRAAKPTESNPEQVKQ